MGRKKGRSKMKRAFTLIELIAIILILALVALIATPLVSNVIAESKKNSMSVTCQQIYNAVERQANFLGKDSCISFDFGRGNTNAETSGDVVYHPISKLQLKGKLPINGQATYCEGKIQVAANDEEYSCIVTKDINKILPGPIGDYDITEPKVQKITSTSTTSSIKVVVTAIDPDGELNEYYYRLDDDKYIVKSCATDNNCHVHEFTGLKYNKEYDVHVYVTNAVDMHSDEVVEKISTKNINSPSYALSSSVPNVAAGYEYYQNKVIKITYNSENITVPSYYLKSTVDVTVGKGLIEKVCGTGVEPSECTEFKDSADSVTTLKANTWYETNKNTIDVTYINNGTLYATLSDEVNISSPSTYTVTNMDSTGPTIQGLVVNPDSIKTDRATIMISCSDLESKITGYEYKYSKDGGKTWTKTISSEKNTYTFNGLSQETNHVFHAKCINGSGMSVDGTVSGTTKGITNPSYDLVEFEPTEKNPDTGNYYEYTKRKVIRIKYNNNNIEEPVYYFKSTVAATVDSGVIVKSCGEGIVPTKNCEESIDTTLETGVWYQTSSTTPSLTYISNGTLYAITGDGTNLSVASTYEISKMDTSSPDIVSFNITDEKTDRATLTANCKDDQSGIIKYEFSKDDGNTWQTNSDLTNNVFTYTGLPQNTKHYYKLRCKNGVGMISVTTEADVGKELMVNPPKFNIESRTPNRDNDYYSNIKLRVTYDPTNVAEPIYYIKSTSEATVPSGTIEQSCGTGVEPASCSNVSNDVTKLSPGVWYKAKKTLQTFTISYSDNGNLYAVTSDGTNLSTTSHYTLSNVDGTVPKIENFAFIKKSDGAKISGNCVDNESKIIKYMFSDNGGKTWETISIDKSKQSYTQAFTKTYSGVTAGSNRSYVVKCVNGAETEATMTEDYVPMGVKKPEFKNVSNVPSKDYSFYTNRVYNIYYDNQGISNPEFYLKSNVEVRLNSGTIKYACDKNVDPSNCVEVSGITTLEANKWYRTNDANIRVEYTSNGTLYAIASDGTNTLRATYDVTNIDTTKPDASLSISVGTNYASIKATCTDAQSGITKYEFSKDGGNYVTSPDGILKDQYTFNGLTQGTKYNFSVRCTNGANVPGTISGSATTDIVEPPEIKNISNTPSTGSEYYVDRTYQISYKGTGKINYFKTSASASVASGVITHSCGTGTNPNTSCSTSNVTTLAANTWYRTSKSSVEIIAKGNGVVYAITGDGNNFSTQDSEEVKKIDSTKPNLTLSATGIYTSQLTISINASDSESGIVSSMTSCKYGLSESSLTSNGEITGNGTCELKNLTANKKYYYKVTVYNGTKVLYTEKTGSAITAPVDQSPTFTNTSNVPNSGYDYFTSRTYKITYDSSKMTTPEYYFKASSTATVASGVVTHSCGTGVNPGTCTASTATSLTAGTWYRAKTSTPSITIKNNGTLYALLSDGINATGTSTLTVGNIDSTAPTITASSINVTTNKAILTISCSDTDTGISKYGFSKNGGEVTYVYTSSGTHTYTGLKSDTEYTFDLMCLNGAGATSKVTKKAETVIPPKPSFTNTSNTPNSSLGYTWYKNRTYQITYNNSTIETPSYYFKVNVSGAVLASGTISGSCGTEVNPGTCNSTSVTSLVANTWYKSTSSTPSVKLSKNGTIYAAIGDGTNFFTATLSETRIDSTGPECSLSCSVNTNRAVLSAACNDPESGMKYYYFSKDNGSSYTSSGSTTGSYTYNGLTSGTKYTFKVKAINGASLEGYASTECTPAKPTAPSFTNTSNNPASGYSYYTSRVYKITYNATGVASPVYYFKSSVDATVASGTVSGQCGSGTNPSTSCSSTNPTSIAAGVWYKASSATPSITMKANGTLYAALGDGINLSDTSTNTVTKIDTTAPTITIGTITKKSDRGTVSFTLADSESGILSDRTTCKYSIYTSSGTVAYDQTGTVSGTTCTITGLKSYTEYAYKITATNGANMSNSKTGTFVTSDITAPTISVPSTCASSKTVTITYPSSDVVTATHKYSKDGSSWITVSGSSTTVSFTSNGTIYARTYDSTGNYKQSSSSVTNIDTTVPTLTLSTASSSTNTITVPFTTSNSGCETTTSVSCVYGTSTSYGSTGTVSGNNCVLSGLKIGTTYYYKVISKDGYGRTKEATGSKATINIGAATITVPSECSASKQVTIVYNSSGISNPTYKYSKDGSSWTTSDWSTTVTFTSNGTIYARTYDGSGNYREDSKAVTNVDSAAPDITLGTVTAKTDSLTIPYTLGATGCSTTTSTVKCQYGTSTSYGSTGTVSGGKCTISGLQQGTTYYYKLTVTDSYSRTDSATGSKATPSIVAPTISVPAGSCSQTKSVAITFNNSNITSPVYEYMDHTGTWKKATSVNTTVSFGYSSSGTIYARTTDGTGNYKQASASVTGIDGVNPVPTVSVSGYTARLSFTDNIGVVAYAVTQSTSTPSSWTTITQTTSTSVNWSPSTYGAYGRYYVHVKDCSGRTAYLAFDITAASYNYNATVTCKAGSTKSGTDCLVPYNTVAQCGCAKYNSSGSCITPNTCNKENNASYRTLTCPSGGKPDGSISPPKCRFDI